MPEVAELWKQALPTVRQSVTGVGVWAALNAAIPISREDDTVYIGFLTHESELAGHLRVPQLKRLMEMVLSDIVGSPITVRVIDGHTVHDVEITKRRDVERRRLQEAELNKLRKEMNSKSSWDSIYEQLSRRYAAVNNKSLPQNRARFLEEAIELVAETRTNQESFDDLGERNFARCIERVAQYTELPTTLIANMILKRAGEL